MIYVYRKLWQFPSARLKNELPRWAIQGYQDHLITNYMYICFYFFFPPVFANLYGQCYTLLTIYQKGAWFAWIFQILVQNIQINSQNVMLYIHMLNVLPQYRYLPILWVHPFSCQDLHFKMNRNMWFPTMLQFKRWRLRSASFSTYCNQRIQLWLYLLHSFCGWFMRLAKALIRLRLYTVWSEPLLVHKSSYMYFKSLLLSYCATKSFQYSYISTS